jgi:hypothetical protein
MTAAAINDSIPMGISWGVVVFGVVVFGCLNSLYSNYFIICFNFVRMGGGGEMSKKIILIYYYFLLTYVLINK